ncbi:MAG: sensor histidine kinase [Acidimicrobiia bacterium]|nr:sensor histidine kinase [Acidimicrobiia bacterium]
MFSSYGAKLRAAFVALGLGAIAVTGWEASVGATAALREATYERLNAIHETRCRQIERYFADLRNQVQALASDESSIAAMEQFRAAWDGLPLTPPDSPRYDSVRKYYETEFAPRVSMEEGFSLPAWLPQDPAATTLQHFYLAANPNPVGSKDLLFSAPGSGRYGEVHARYHPTLHRFHMAFGWYDIFLIEPRQGRIVYTVFKEIDLGASLVAGAFSDTALARAYQRAVKLEDPGKVVLEDYAPYPASYFAPAAFAAAPIRRAGMTIGVLAVQVSIEEVNRVMTGDRRWREEGLGETGQAFVVGPDGALRSDLRFEVEKPEEYLRQLERAGASREILDRVRRYKTAILNLKVPETLMQHITGGGRDTELGRDSRGVEVLRAHAPLDVPELNWTLIAEIEAEEANAPMHAVRIRIIGWGLVIAGAFFLAATLLARSVTQPVLALADSVRRLGRGDFRMRIPVERQDEIGQLAQSFNRMVEDLERTTVSKEELEKLAGRLITAQEEERSRLARDLHDDLTQRLAAVAIEAGRLQRMEQTPELQSGLERIKEQMAALSRDIHGLSRRLHPSTLEDLGLVSAVESECRGFFDRGGPPVELQQEGNCDGLPPEIALGIYRIVQESLRNIYRHSAAAEVSITIRRKKTKVLLEIRDNGRGFDRAAPGWRAGLGLASMEERARLLGGRLSVESQPGQGTRVDATLPVREENEAA